MKPEWQPIETAPKTRDDVILWDGISVDIGWWYDNCNHALFGPPAWISLTKDAEGEAVVIEPTHWMPLPPGPQP